MNTAVSQQPSSSSSAAAINNQRSPPISTLTPVPLADCMFFYSSQHVLSNHTPGLAHSSSQSHSFPVYIPPTGFAFVEEKLCRAWGPILPSMFSLLDCVNVGTIVNVSGEPLDRQALDFLSESNIKLVNFDSSFPCVV